MTKLHLAGEKLGKMETSKKQAIQQEDYSKAKKKKLQIEEFKSQIYSNLNIENLLEKNGVSKWMFFNGELLLVASSSESVCSRIFKGNKFIFIF